MFRQEVQDSLTNQPPVDAEVDVNVGWFQRESEQRKKMGANGIRLAVLAAAPSHNIQIKKITFLTPVRFNWSALSSALAAVAQPWRNVRVAAAEFRCINIIGSRGCCIWQRGPLLVRLCM